MRVPRAVVRAVARLKPVVPEAAWPLLLSLRSLAGDGPIVGMPRFQRVVALGAHPDDETAGCGGLLARLAADGTDIDVVIATDGEATIGADLDTTEVARRRQGEAAAACARLGVTKPPRFLGLPDGGLPARIDDLSEALGPILNEARPQAVLLPWFLDGHPDHQALARAVAGLDLGPDVVLWGYETWTPLPANRIVDITSVVDTKAEALAAYVTAHLAFDVSSMLGLSRYRSAHGLLGRGHAEAFLAAAAPEWAALAEGRTRT